MGLLRHLPGAVNYAEVAFDVASVAAVTAVEQDITVPGITTNSLLVGFEPPALGLALGVGAARIKSAGVVAVTFVNPSAGALDPAAGLVFKFAWTDIK
jgi:hypothetical protein